MVKLEKNKIVIEIETNDPDGDVYDLQADIIYALKYYDYENFGNNNGCPFSRLLDLLGAMLPNREYYKNLLTQSCK